MSVGRKVTGSKKSLVIDAVAIEGTTIQCAFRHIREVHPDAEISAATAGQMIVKDGRAMCS